MYLLFFGFHCNREPEMMKNLTELSFCSKSSVAKGLKYLNFYDSHKTGGLFISISIGAVK